MRPGTHVPLRGTGSRMPRGSGQAEVQPQDGLVALVLNRNVPCPLLPPKQPNTAGGHAPMRARLCKTGGASVSY